MKKMKTKWWIVLGFLLLNLISFGQNQKCLLVSNDIIKDVKGKIINQYVGVDDVYTMKVEVSSAYDINTIKMACDTTKFKTIIDWKINYDKNYEKQVLIGNEKMLITFYPNDKIIYFEFSKK